MTFSLEQYDEIKHCLHCQAPIKSIRLALLQRKIPEITEAGLKALKLCQPCKIKLSHKE